MLLKMFVFFNFFFMFFYSLGHFVVLRFEMKPKVKAFYGVLLAAFMATWLLSATAVSIWHRAWFLLFFPVSTFVIGKFVSYKTLRVYSAAQLMLIVGSLMYCMYIILPGDVPYLSHRFL